MWNQAPGGRIEAYIGHDGELPGFGEIAIPSILYRSMDRADLVPIKIAKIGAIELS